MRDRMFVMLQHLLPRYAMTALVYWLARIRVPAVKDFLISRFVQHFKVDLTGVAEPVPGGFASFNEFFVRALDAEARPIAGHPDVVVSPVDGTVSRAAGIRGNQILQAKGIDYSLEDLLVVDSDRARSLESGCFATIYLAPYNYHRVHAPLAGRLDAIHYVPGDLFSVNAATVRNLPGLFRRNERLTLHFETPVGPAAVILVGALNVGSITTPWTGEIRPQRRGVAESVNIDPNIRVEKGDLLGWFNMGSTVIVLLPPGGPAFDPGLEPGDTLVMGQPIGTLTPAEHD